jgi:hypothetical protein
MNIYRLKFGMQVKLTLLMVSLKLQIPRMLSDKLNPIKVGKWGSADLI